MSILYCYMRSDIITMHDLLYYIYIFLLPILNTHVYKLGTCDSFITYKIKLLPYDIITIYIYIYIIFSCV